MRRNLTPWGRMVKTELINRGWTRIVLSEKTGLSQNYLSLIMRDPDPAPAGVEKVNAVLGIAAPAESTA